MSTARRIEDRLLVSDAMAMMDQQLADARSREKAVKANYYRLIHDMCEDKQMVHVDALMLDCLQKHVILDPQQRMNQGLAGVGEKRVDGRSGEEGKGSKGQHVNDPSGVGFEKEDESNTIKTDWSKWAAQYSPRSLANYGNECRRQNFKFLDKFNNTKRRPEENEPQATRELSALACTIGLRERLNSEVTPIDAECENITREKKACLLKTSNLKTSAKIESRDKVAGGTGCRNLKIEVGFSRGTSPQLEERHTVNGKVLKKGEDTGVHTPRKERTTLDLNRRLDSSKSTAHHKLMNISSKLQSAVKNQSGMKKVDVKNITVADFLGDKSHVKKGGRMDQRTGNKENLTQRCFGALELSNTLKSTPRDTHRFLTRQATTGNLHSGKQMRTRRQGSPPGTPMAVCKQMNLGCCTERQTARQTMACQGCNCRFQSNHRTPFCGCLMSNQPRININLNSDIINISRIEIDSIDVNRCVIRLTRNDRSSSQSSSSNINESRINISPLVHCQRRRRSPDCHVDDDVESIESMQASLNCRFAVISRQVN